MGKGVLRKKGPHLAVDELPQILRTFCWLSEEEQREVCVQTMKLPEL